MSVLPDSVTNQCQYVNKQGKRCETRKLKLGRSGFCSPHQKEHDESDEVDGHNRYRSG